VTIGVLQTAINAVTLALIDAGIPMNDYVCATSAGLVGENAILGIHFRFIAHQRSQQYRGDRYPSLHYCHPRQDRKDSTDTGSSSQLSVSLI